MKRLTPFFAALIFLGLASGFGYLIFLAGAKAVTYFAAFESEFAAALVATAGTVIIGVVTLLLTLRESKQREIREAHRAQKVDVYKRFIETAIVGLLRQVVDGKKLSEQEMVEKYQDFFITFTADLIVWGSPGVIKAFRDYRRAAAAEQSNVLLYIDEILKEIRKDLGNSNWGITTGELMSTFLRDPDEIKALIEAGK